MPQSQVTPRFGYFYFGVEIEAIAEHKTRALFTKCYVFHNPDCDLAYGLLASRKRVLGLDVEAEMRSGHYKSRQDVERWTIMKDTSLETPAPPVPASKFPRVDISLSAIHMDPLIILIFEVALEAVSLTLSTRRSWEPQIQSILESSWSRFRDLMAISFDRVPCLCFSRY